MKITMMTIGLPCAFVVAACASKPPPTARVGSSEAAVRAAHEVGAEKVPDAQMHLKMAEDQLAQARRMIADGDYDKAEWLLVRAESDAEVAVALAHEAQTKEQAESMTAQVRSLSVQMNQRNPM